MLLQLRSVEQFEPPTPGQLKAELDIDSTAVALASAGLHFRGEKGHSQKVLTQIATRSPIDHFGEHGSAISARQRLISDKAANILRDSR